MLEYALDQPERGINWRCKAQILNEMFLALGIYLRKVWIMPESIYDDECHVVNEEEKPLSVLEIRQLVANQEFCTPVYYGDDCSDLKKSLNNNYGLYLYYLKNLVYTGYCDTMTVGNQKKFILFYLKTILWKNK